MTTAPRITLQFTRQTLAGVSSSRSDYCKFRQELRLIYILIYTFEMKANRKTTRGARSIQHPGEDPLAQFVGPAQTIAASVPRALNAAIRARIGKRGFSRFVGQALARELVDQNRAAYVASFEMDHGPIDPELTARLEALLNR